MEGMSIDQFRSLPPAIYLYIQSFIPNDYKHFTNTCKIILHEIKYETIYYNLNQFYSLKFCQNSEFRNNILSKVKHRRYQISINLRQFTAMCEFHRNIAPIPSLINSKEEGKESQFQPIYLNASEINRLKLLGIKTIETLEIFNNIPELVFYSFPNVTSTTGLVNVEKLSIHSFHSLTTLTNMPYLQECKLYDCFALSDVTPLANVNILHLENCNQVINVNPLGNHFRLSIILCGGAKIPDISTLGRVKRSIELVGCDLISDISVLRNIPDIKLRNFQRVLNAAGFDLGKEDRQSSSSSSSNIISLTLENVNLIDYKPLRLIPIIKLLNITNLNEEALSCFHSVQSLEISRSHFITIIPYLPYLQKLKLKDCRPLNCNFQHIQHVPNVSIESYQGSIDLRLFSNIRHLQLLSCPNLSHFDKLGNHTSIALTDINFNTLKSLEKVPEIKIINCSYLKDAVLQKLTGVAKLTLERSRTFSDTSDLGHLQYLHLSYCLVLKKLVGIENVKVVIIEYCEKLEDISGLGNNDVVRLYKCGSIKNVLPLINVKEVKISYCKGIINIECLKNLVKYVN